MAKHQPIDVLIKNLARGGQDYSRFRLRIALTLLRSDGPALRPLSPYLSRQLFAMDREPTKLALPLHDKDWPILARLLSADTPAIRESYLRLVLEFLKSNTRRLEVLHATDVRVSKALIESDAERFSENFHNLDEQDRQSLYAFRLYSAMNYLTHANIASHFSRENHSPWVRKRFLYPLIFAYINLPSISLFDQMLDQQFSGIDTKKAEKTLVRFLLRNEAQVGIPLAFKCYIALLCHPYDALAMLSDHLDLAIATRRTFTSGEAAILHDIAACSPSPHIRNQLRLLAKVPLAYSREISAGGIAHNLGLKPSAQQHLDRFLGKDHLTAEEVTEIPGMLGALATMRWTRYPEADDFELVTLEARRYAFTMGGRLLCALMTSIYMWERSPAVDEFCKILHLIHVTECVTPFMLLGPRGAEAINAGLFSLQQFGTITQIEAEVDAFVNEFDVTQDRWWIKVFHWKQRRAERQLRLSEWMKAIRASIPLSSNKRYLSGIDWSFIDSVIEAQRIRPFLGNVDGIYLLLLRLLEQRSSEITALRLALRPFIQKKKLHEFVDWLSTEYKGDSIAFIRYFLSADTILQMELEANYTAAITERLTALEKSVKQYGFDKDLLTPAQLEQEQKALTTALTLMRVAAHQFEVSWETLKQDAIANNDDWYKTYTALKRLYNALGVLSAARKKSQYQFSNAQLMTYDFANKDWPIVHVFCRIIDTFLSHPSYGIESILAVRIRHDNFRREFNVALEALKHTQVQGISVLDRRRLIPFFEPIIYHEIQEWVDKYMHTGRAAPETALFDFRPSQGDMEGFVQGCDGDATFEQITECVLSWISEKLNERLSVAREKLSTELIPALAGAISKVRAELVQKEVCDAECAKRVTAAVSSTVAARAEELNEWFRAPIIKQDESMTFAELQLAVEGRFSFEIDTKKLRMDGIPQRVSQREIKAENIRQLFDLWCEIALNALKYSRRNIAHVRATPVDNIGGFWGLLFSSLGKSTEKSVEYVGGHPYESITDAIFKSGNSGLEKIAYLAASVARTSVSVGIARTLNGFHVFVPLGRVFEEGQ